MNPIDMFCDGLPLCLAGAGLLDNAGALHFSMRVAVFQLVITLLLSFLIAQGPRSVIGISSLPRRLINFWAITSRIGRSSSVLVANEMA